MRTVALRFCVIYFALYVLLTQMLFGLFPLPIDIDVAEIGTLTPFRQLTVWVATHVIGVQGALQVDVTGSGDRTFDYAQVVMLLGIAAIGTIIWSLIDRTRDHHASLQKWFRLFLRFSLASTMTVYGMVKAYPLQMSSPSLPLTRLLEPYGNLSPMGVLWSSQ